jgi:hypothetical protein
MLSIQSNGSFKDDGESKGMKIDPCHLFEWRRGNPLDARIN